MAVMQNELPDTEGAQAALTDMATWPSARLVAGMLDDQARAIDAIRAVSEAVALVVDAIAPRLEAGGRLVFVGAGTSGRIAVQEAAELRPTFGWPAERAIALMAGGGGAILSAVEGAEDDGPAGAAAIAALNPKPEDCILGIAASGSTPFTCGALEQAGKAGALTVGIVNSPEGRLAALADHPLILRTGAEFLAGSTRLKAGTSQKIVLNLITTGAMVRLGLVYQGLMVAVEVTNAKLRQRAIRIVAEIAKTPVERAQDALEQTEWNTRAAILVAAHGLAPEAAAGLLLTTNGHLARAIAATQEGRVT